MRQTVIPTIAITGANGFLGQALMHHFSEQGYRVLALARKPLPDYPKGVQYITYDLASSFEPNILKNVDYLVHAAYIKQDHKHPNAFQTNVKAAEDLITAARQHKLKKCLFISSMSAHENAVSTYGKQKMAIEKIFSGPDCSSIRSGLIIGDGGLVKQMTEFMRSKHMVPLVGDGKQPLQIIAVSDLVLAIDKLLHSHISDVLTLATPQVYTYKQVYQAISKHTGVKILYVPIPFFALINVIRLINILPIPIAVNPDNALGLKALRASDTAADLKKAGIKLKNLETALADI